MSIDRWKVATCLLLVTSLMLAYRVVDQGISSTYASASLNTSIQHVELLKGLIQREWLGLEQDVVFKRLQAYADASPSRAIVLKQEAGAEEIFLEGITFRFRDHKLVSVQ